MQFLSLLQQVKLQIKTKMLFKTTLYTIPTRTLPFLVNNFRAGTITKASHPISIIRSPHIDKKSWEQFKFFMQKKTKITKQLSNLRTTLQFAQILRKMIAPLRIKITISYYHKLHTTF